MTTGVTVPEWTAVFMLTGSNDRIILGEFLNFCPIISVEGSQMRELDTNKLLQQLKRAYAERVVLNGFDDVNLYNDALLRLDDLEIEKFQTLNGIIGSSKAQQKTKNIDINAQGFTEEEYEAIKRAERKPTRERTPEETALLFLDFIKYYDPEIFIGAGHRIRTCW